MSNREFSTEDVRKVVYSKEYAEADWKTSRNRLRDDIVFADSMKEPRRLYSLIRMLACEVTMENHEGSSGGAKVTASCPGLYFSADQVRMLVEICR